jgi:hypothetical protein
MSGITETRSETAGLPEEQQFTTPMKPVAVGIAAGYSSVEPSDQGEPQAQKSDDGEPLADRWFETEEIPDIRFCALLDSILPECVVDYLEQLCMSIYNSLFRRSEAALIQRADSATLDLSDDEKGAGSAAQKPKTPKQAAVEKLLEPLSPGLVEDDASEPN